MVMDISGLPDLAENDEGNYLKANDGIDVAARIAHATYEVDCSAGGTIALVRNGLPSDSYVQGYRFKLTGTPGAAFNLQVPDGDRRIEVWNATGQDATVDTATGAASPVTVGAGSRAKVIVDGTDLERDFAEVLIGRQTIFVPAGAMYPTATQGATAAATTEIVATGVNILHVDFPDGANETRAQFAIVLPKSWNGGVLRYRARYSHAGGQTAGQDGVVFGVKALARGDGESLGTAFGSEITVTKDAASADTEHVTPESADLTPAGTPAGGEVVYFEIARKVLDALDDLNIAARLHGVEIYYETAAGTDD